MLVESSFQIHTGTTIYIYTPTHTTQELHEYNCKQGEGSLAALVVVSRHFGWWLLAAPAENTGMLAVPSRV